MVVGPLSILHMITPAFICLYIVYQHYYTNIFWIICQERQKQEHREREENGANHVSSQIDQTFVTKQLWKNTESGYFI